MGLKDLGKLLTGEAAKKRIRKETKQKEPMTRDYSSMDETDLRRMEAFDKALKKKEESEDKYECGGVKYSKLKKYLKGKKD